MMNRYQVKLNFTNEILGSQPANEELKTTYIVNKMTTGKTGMSADVAMSVVKEEIEDLKNDEKYQETIKELQSNSLTVFQRDKEKRICIHAVQLRGFIKQNFAFVAKQNKWFRKAKSDDIYSSDSYYRNWVGDRFMIVENKIPFDIQPEKISVYQRPLRAETMQGPRVSIASSEIIYAPNSISFELRTYPDFTDAMIIEVFERGQMRGLGQFSNGQYGTFDFEIEKITV